MIANNFGANVGGVTVVRDAPINEIFIHEQFLAGVTGGFKGEREYILLGGEMEHKVSDITLPGDADSDGGQSLGDSLADLFL